MRLSSDIRYDLPMQADNYVFIEAKDKIEFMCDLQGMLNCKLFIMSKHCYILLISDGF